MTNPLKGESAIDVEGKAYILLLDVNALITIEEETGITADRLHAEFSGLVNDAAAPKKLARLRQLIHLALLEKQPGVTLEDAGRVMTAIGGYLPALRAFADAINASWPIADKDGEARPRKRAARAGTG